jgi:hypothetical protein
MLEGATAMWFVVQHTHCSLRAVSGCGWAGLSAKGEVGLASTEMVLLAGWVAFVLGGWRGFSTMYDSQSTSMWCTFFSPPFARLTGVGLVCCRRLGKAVTDIL